MSEYFKPLRRKIGVVTLGLACLFAALWVRGTTVHDEFSTSTFTQPSHRMVFENGATFIDNILVPQNSSSRTLEAENAMRVSVVSEMCWVQIFEISHGIVVIPLTLISVWLLLGKPRSKATIDGPSGHSLP